MKKARLGMLAAAVATVTGFLTPVASAASAAAVHLQDSARTWTPEAMRAATPLDRIVGAAGNLLTQVHAGAPAAIPASASDSGGPWTGGGKVTHTAGRVFFLFNGAKASCSGEAVTSGNKSVVITAGHCVKYQGSWHTNWVFVPGYHDGDAPYGQWPAAQTLTTPQWQASEDLNYDVGAAVVAPLNGKRLTDVVGGQGIAFNQARGQRMYSFGYPAEGKYDGTRLDYCSGSTFTDVISSNDNGMSCDMTGGSSGGPWFLNFDEATGAGLQNSVNSFGYNFLPGYMFGPYFGSDVQNLYRTAQSK